MAFLNKKEDVIDLELTQYGKYLVSQGKFKPTYYAFYDDDIIYDQRYATGGGLETQKDIENRILVDTPTLSAQYLFHSVDNLEMQDGYSRTDEMESEKIQQVPEKHYALNNPIASSELATDKAPAFDITLKKGEIKRSETTISGSVNEAFSIQQVPQIKMKDVKYFITVKDDEGNDNFIVDRYEDGTYLHVQDNYILLEVEENNVPINRDNFELEVYVVDDNNKIQYPLYFSETKEMVVDGILLDEEEQTPQGPPAVDEVRYYFDILTDDAAAPFLTELERKQQAKQARKERRRERKAKSGKTEGRQRRRGNRTGGSGGSTQRRRGNRTGGSGGSTGGGSGY